MATRLSWLHLTDLHRGLTDQDHLWPNVESDFYDDLEQLHERCGPWDLVLFTGDLTQRGSPDEFRSLDRILTDLQRRLRALGSDPILLAVPGNHDLARPAEPVPPAIEVLSRWTHHPRVQKTFWSEAANPYRSAVASAFSSYQEWWRRPERPFRRPADASCREGLLPGEFSMIVEKEGTRFGVVGLNTAFLQLEGGDYRGRLALHTAQLNAACGGSGPTWAKGCDACILMTHHPPDWLDPRSRDEHFAPHVAEFFAVHLHGHMHENRVNGFLVPGVRPRYLVQGCSLFGLEAVGDDGLLSRQHGYAAGWIEFDGSRAELRLWPRQAVKTSGGPWQIVADTRMGRPESDQGTRPLPIERLRKPPHARAKPSSPGIGLDDRLPQRPGNAYNPHWYVPRENEERWVLDHLANDGAAATIVWGPPLHGKTWFLKHILQEAAKGADTGVIEINVETLPSELFDEQREVPEELRKNRFLRELAVRIGTEAWAAEAWEALPRNPVQALGVMMERHVLGANRRVLLVLENFHALLDCGFHGDLFSMFRAWNQDASRSPWSNLRLLLGMSIDADRFRQEQDVSNFLTTAFKLKIGGFTPEQAKKLRQLYRLSWTDEQLNDVLGDLQRHPYLIRLAMYLSATGAPFDQLFGVNNTTNFELQTEIARLLVRKP